MDSETLALIAEWEGMEVTPEYAEQVADRYLGEAETVRDWAEQYIDDTGMLDEMPESLRYYFDTEAWLHDAQLSGDITVVPIGLTRVVVLHN